MRTLQDALNDAEEFPVGEEAYNRTEDAWIVDVAIVEAARRVANCEPKPFARYVRLGGISLESCDPEDADVWIVDAAALGITEDTE